MNTTKKIPAIIFSRVVGYFSPVDGWNKGKQEEFKHRKEISKDQINKYTKDYNK